VGDARDLWPRNRTSRVVGEQEERRVVEGLKPARGGTPWTDGFQLCPNQGMKPSDVWL
jgi:hypothetical protein